MSLHSRLRQQVKVRAYRGVSSSGPIYTDPILTPARIEYENKLIRNADGDQVVASTTVYLGRDVTLPAGSRIMLPLDADWDTTPTTSNTTAGRTVMQVGVVADGNGRTHHLEVSLQ